MLNTHQCYLKRTPAAIDIELEACKHLGTNFMVKIVRGAYMEEERELAKKHGYESPIWDTIDGTHSCYNAVAAKIIESLGKNDILFLASHNEETVNKVMKLIEDKPHLKDQI